MPNHIVTVIDAPKQVIDALCRKLTPEEIAKEQAEHQSVVDFWADKGNPYTAPAPDPERLVVDFGLIIPEPESMFHGGCNGQHPHPKEDGSGFYKHCWYGWNTQNWGTKWNAYSIERRSDTQLKFETAWSHPWPVMQALSKRFPDILIDVRYADEDLGANLSHHGLKDGEAFPAEDDPEEGTEWATQFAAQLHGYDWEEYKREREEDEVYA